MSRYPTGSTIVTPALPSPNWRSSPASGDEEQVADRVGQLPVDLLGHPHVKGTKPRLHVSHLYAKFLRGQSTGDRGVDVAYDGDEIRPVFQHDLLERNH